MLVGEEVCAGGYTMLKGLEKGAQEAKKGLRANSRTLPAWERREMEIVPNGAPSGNGRSCPSCSSVDCHRSKRHGWRDFFHRLVGMFPWYCRMCRQRFYLRKRSPG